MKILDIPQSGSTAGTTSSRNRFGQYRRTRATPVNPNTTAQSSARARLSESATSWRGLTDAQRAGWTSLGEQMTRTDSLGQAYTLTGFQAFVSVNSVLLYSGGAALSAAPALSSPDALLTTTITSTGGTLSVAYTATPMPANTKLAVFASPQRSAGRSFEGDYRLLGVTAAAAASPFNALATYTAKFGAPVVGNKIFIMLVAIFSGFESSPLYGSHIVVT
jgi:hypothetical protein